MTGWSRWYARLSGAGAGARRLPLRHRVLQLPAFNLLLLGLALLGGAAALWLLAPPRPWGGRLAGCR